QPLTASRAASESSDAETRHLKRRTLPHSAQYPPPCDSPPYASDLQPSELRSLPAGRAATRARFGPESRLAWRQSRRVSDAAPAAPARRANRPSPERDS